jgi:hypothetical protein
LLVPDYGRREVGRLRWKPFDDSEMRVALNGEMPPEDDDGDYLAAWRWPVLVHGVGMRRMTTTSRAFIAAARRWFDAFVAAPEAAAGFLCVYRAGESSSYKPKRVPDAGTFYAPRWRTGGWMQRAVPPFANRLIGPPAALAAGALPAVPTDALFDGMAMTGEGLAPSPKPKPARPSRAAGLVPASDDLDDEIPF